MYRLFFALFVMASVVIPAIAMGDEHHEPLSIEAEEGKTVYISISPSVNFIDESKIQQEDQNITKHGQAK